MKAIRALLLSSVLLVLTVLPSLAQQSDREVTIELIVTGIPPEEATFFALAGPSVVGDYLGGVQLTDTDRDGVYTGSFPVSSPEPFNIAIVRGAGTRDGGLAGMLPGEPVTTIRTFHGVVFESDTVLTASVAFDGPDDIQQKEGSVPGMPNTGAGGKASGASSLRTIAWLFWPSSVGGLGD